MALMECLHKQRQLHPGGYSRRAGSSLYHASHCLIKQPFPKSLPSPCRQDLQNTVLPAHPKSSASAPSFKSASHNLQLHCAPALQHPLPHHPASSHLSLHCSRCHLCFKPLGKASLSPPFPLLLLLRHDFSTRQHVPIEPGLTRACAHGFCACLTCLPGPPWCP